MLVFRTLYANEIHLCRSSEPCVFRCVATAAHLFVMGDQKMKSTLSELWRGNIHPDEGKTENVVGHCTHHREKRNVARYAIFQ